MTRGLQCARFEVHTVGGREDMYNKLDTECCKGIPLHDTNDGRNAYLVVLVMVLLGGAYIIMVRMK